MKTTLQNHGFGSHARQESLYFDACSTLNLTTNMLYVIKKSYTFLKPKKSFRPKKIQKKNNS